MEVNILVIVQWPHVCTAITREVVIKTSLKLQFHITRIMEVILTSIFRIHTKLGLFLPSYFLEECRTFNDYVDIKRWQVVKKCLFWSTLRFKNVHIEVSTQVVVKKGQNCVHVVIECPHAEVTKMAKFRLYPDHFTVPKIDLIFLFSF